jgi:hypothetical protein
MLRSSPCRIISRPFSALANKPGAPAAEIATGPLNCELVQKPTGLVLEPDPSPRRAELLHERPSERRRVTTEIIAQIFIAEVAGPNRHEPFENWAT